MNRNYLLQLLLLELQLLEMQLWRQMGYQALRAHVERSAE